MDFLFGSEDPVSRVSKTRADIRVLVETAVQVAYIDLDIRMSLMKTLQAFGSSYNAHEFDGLSAVLLMKSMADTAEPPVASIGSVTTMVLWSMGLGSLQ